MLRPLFRPCLALLLLLCLVRTLLPEAWVLALHGHSHTREEPAFSPSQPKFYPGQALLTTRHMHCHTEQFYDVPFAAASPVVLPLPRQQLSYLPLAGPTTLACSAATLRRTALRGPPPG